MKLFFHLGENSRLATENLRTFSLGYDNSEDVEQNEKFMFITRLETKPSEKRFKSNESYKVRQWKKLLL
jgi:hypothetical protein